MNVLNRYLQLPTLYARWLGGLRWSDGEEAIEYPTGTTFVFSREIAEFIEGFGCSGKIIEFAHILHLLHLIGVGKLSTASDPNPLVELFRARKRPMRNAGALCATLCHAVPAHPAPPELDELLHRLNRGPFWTSFESESTSGARSDPGLDFVCNPDDQELFQVIATPALPEPEPALSPAEFEARVLEALSQFDMDTLHHWLKTGRGPIEFPSDDLASEVTLHRARSIGELLDDVLLRPGIESCSALVPLLTGAITIPPRKLDHRWHPVGGFSDISTRGAFEQLLPSQLALDNTELIRRFAEKELLFYHREEPFGPQTEEVVVLLDQGVRTWGGVRLALTAALVAIGKLAESRRLQFLIGTTGTTATPRNLQSMGSDEIGRLLESTDFTEDPAETLANALSSFPNPVPRDLILLSHPRSIRSPNLQRVASSLPTNLRLFALTVDDHGQTIHSRIQNGQSVPLAHFRISLPESGAPRLRPIRSQGALADWSGAVEPVAYPFRLRVPAFGKSRGRRAVFTGLGRELVVLGDQGTPIVVPQNGSAPYLLPRPYLHGQIPGAIEDLLGLAGGLVLVVHFPTDGLRLAHYDFNASVLTLHEPPGDPNALWEWFVIHDQNRLIGRSGHHLWDLSMNTGTASDLSIENDEWNNVGLQDWIQAQTLAPPHVLALHDRDTLPGTGPWVRLRTDSGTLLFHGANPPWRPFRPISDGEPLLRNHRIEYATYEGNLLGIGGQGRSRERTLHLFRGPGDRLPERPWPDHVEWDYVISPDGLRIAMPIDSRTIGVFEVDRRAPPLITCRPNASSLTSLALGKAWLAIHLENVLHVIRWDHPRIIHECSQIDKLANPFEDPLFHSRMPHMLAMNPTSVSPAALQYDKHRFRRSYRGYGIVATVDQHGQVILHDAHGDLILILYAENDQLAGWTPDGLRFGPIALSGSPPTPGVMERIASRLRAQSGLSERSGLQ